MKTSKLFAVLSAITVLMTGCGQSAFGNSKSNSSMLDDSVLIISETYDTDALLEQVNALKEIWNSDGKDTEISETIQYLVEEVDKAYAIKARAEIQYYSDMEKNVLYDYYAGTLADFYAAEDLVRWAFANGYRKSQYAELFESYVSEENMEYFITNNAQRVISNARAEASSYSEALNDYYDVIYDSDIDVDEANLMCAQMYLDILDTYDTSNYLYDLYYRDYDVSQTSAIYETAMEQLAPIMEELEKAVKVSLVDVEIDATEMLRTYAPKLSPAIGASAERLFKDELFFSAEGEGCYAGGYTIPIPSEDCALVYMYLAGDAYDWESVSHEFGHFYADCQDKTHILQMKNCIDIAEVQSQGMEILFTTLFDEMFGDKASALELLTLYDILDSVLSGLTVGEFEYEVMQKADEMTPEDVVALYDKICERYPLGFELYEITHLFEQPGYYVSYGVSALPALELYTVLQNDVDEGISLYNRIAAISSNSGEYQFCQAMRECGMKDIFDSQIIIEMADGIQERINQLIPA